MKKYYFRFFRCVILIFSINFLINSQVFSGNLENNKIDLNKENNIKFFGKYLIGPGDRLNITFLGNKDFSGEYTIMSDGTLPLPLIGSIRANFISIEKLTQKIIALYSDELIRPDLFIKVIEKRPVQVSVIGEINRPGLYKLFNIQSASVPKVFNDSDGDFVNLPTIVDAIAKAGGITPRSNLKSVLVKRRLEGQVSRYQKINLDLINLLMKGDQSQNLILFDGDIIEINKVKVNAKMPTKVLEIARSNLSPKNITINVIGEVEKPGEYKVKSNTTLNKGILIANGFTPWKGNKKNVQLLRINSDGSIFVKKYKYKINEKVSDNKNPPLIDGDIIKVNRTNFAKVAGGIEEVSKPLINILSSYAFFDLIVD